MQIVNIFFGKCFEAGSIDPISRFGLDNDKSYSGGASHVAVQSVKVKNI